MKTLKKNIIFNLLILLSILVYSFIAMNTGMLYGFNSEEIINMGDSPVYLTGCFFGMCAVIILESLVKLGLDIIEYIRYKLWMKKHIDEIMSDFEEESDV